MLTGVPPIKARVFGIDGRLLDYERLAKQSGYE